MASRTPLPVDLPLGRCPRSAQWAAIFSLPPRGEQLLAELERYTWGTAVSPRGAPRRSIISALILHAPEDPWEIAGLSLWSPRAGPMPEPGTPADVLRRRTHVWLPAPISLRLNRLIEHAGEVTGQRCSRTAIVVSMMELARAGNRDVWTDRFAHIMERPAVDAALVIDSPQSVLLLRRPKPGPRPLP